MATELELPGEIHTYPDGRMPIEELYKAYTSLLEKGWQLDIITQSQPQGRDYALPIIALRTPHSGEACWIIAGIHGEEPAGPNAIARAIDDIAALGEQQAVVLLPLNNPQGYANNWRYLNMPAWSDEVEGQSVGDSSHLLTDPAQPGLSRASVASSPEADAITRYLVRLSAQYPPASSIDLHEDELISEGYVYSQGTLGAADPLALAAVRVLEENGIPLKISGQTRFGEPISGGIIGPVIDGSIDELMSAGSIIVDGQAQAGPGAHTVLVFETPAGQLSLSRRIDAHVALLSSLVHGHAAYDERQLQVKQLFSERELAALAQPFVGVTADGTPVPGLFPIQATGVTTEPVRKAAAGFLGALTPAQLLRTQFSVNDPEWRRWSNVGNGIYTRQGISLKEMTATQRRAAMNLLRTSLSNRGLRLSRDIMKTDQTLREINNDVLSYDEELYFFTLMGTPSASEPWGWQIDGHHLIINTFVMGDQVVMAPVFLGGEPVVATSGKYAGNTILQEEQKQGLALMKALDPSQRATATISPVKEGDNNQAEAGKDNVVVEYAGIPARSFLPEQKAQLLQLVELFVANMDDGHARIRMEEIAARLDDTWFAWIGEVSDEAVFYYRIHSPVVLIEFDHQRPVGTRRLNSSREPTRDHIHVVMRTPNGNDYGKDLLRQHLEQHAH
jgi:hypothetical protein